MGFTVDRTSAFEYDVDEAICYLVNEVGSPRAANLLLDEIERTIGILEEAPYINGLSLRYGLGEAGMREHRSAEAAAPIAAGRSARYRLGKLRGP